MDHHASYLSWILTELLRLPRHGWGAFAHGEALSVIERYDCLLATVLALVVTILLVSLTKRERIPGPMQQIMEMAVKFIRGMVHEGVAHEADRYVPIVGAMAFFVLLNNLFGLAPGIPSGSANWNVPLGCALVVFFYYNFHGMRVNGVVRYWVNFKGPIWWLVPLMWPLEIISLFCRILSHSLRLFGNIIGEHVLAAMCFMAIPFFLPVPMLFVSLFFALIQVFVFVLLTSIYISGAVSHEH